MTPAATNRRPRWRALPLWFAAILAFSLASPAVSFAENPWVNSRNAWGSAWNAWGSSPNAWGSIRNPWTNAQNPWVDSRNSWGRAPSPKDDNGWPHATSEPANAYGGALLQSSDVIAATPAMLPCTVQAIASGAIPDGLSGAPRAAKRSASSCHGSRFHRKRLAAGSTAFASAGPPLPRPRPHLPLRPRKR